MRISDWSSDVCSSAFDLSQDPRYAGIDVPVTESLKLTIERVLPFWEQAILPVLARGETVIISAHGNSLRALVKHLSHIRSEEHTSELQPLMRISYAFFFLKNKITQHIINK